jgi:hypothetical protein
MFRDQSRGFGDSPRKRDSMKQDRAGGQTAYRAVTILAVVVAAAAIALGTTRRVADPRNSMCLYTDEFSEVMPGLRLHALPLWNLGADVRANFFKSAMMSRHGLGDTGFYYLASGALGVLHLPVSDRHLWLAGAFTNALLIVSVAWFAWRVAGSGVMAYTATVILALSALYIFASQTGWARYTFTPLLQMIALNLVSRSSRHRSAWLDAALALLTLFLTLSDAFYFGVVLVVFRFLLYAGPFGARARSALRDSTVWCICGAIVLGLAINIAGAVVAAAHQTTLTLFGYVTFRTARGGALSIADWIDVWLTTVRTYLPIVGPFVVLPSWLLAWRYAWRDPAAGALAVWLAIASAGVIQYFNSFTPRPPSFGMGIFMLSASPLALPSYLVVAWAIGRVVRERRQTLARVVAALVFAAVVAPMAAQAMRDRYDPALTAKAPRYFEIKDQCAVVKAASAYVREDGPPESTVLQLTSDNQLGVMGEFYYGISYVGNARTGERNRLLDYGDLALGRRHTPEELATLYGVPHFDYYVDFIETKNPFTVDAIARLQLAGARPVVEIRDGERVIGRVWSFRSRPATVIALDELNDRWNRVGYLPQLFRQSLAGTAFYFGYAWPDPAALTSGTRTPRN